VVAADLDRGAEHLLGRDRGMPHAHRLEGVGVLDQGRVEEAAAGPGQPDVEEGLALRHDRRLAAPGGRPVKSR
jgi:hypothetical protein